MDVKIVLLIILVIVLVLAAVYIIFRLILDKQLTRTQVIEFVFDCILFAEENIVGTKLGKEKLSYVCGKLNSFLPKFLQPIITAKILEDFVNEIFMIMKQELQEVKEEEDGKVQLWVCWW